MEILPLEIIAQISIFLNGEDTCSLIQAYLSSRRTVTLSVLNSYIHNARYPSLAVIIANYPKELQNGVWRQVNFLIQTKILSTKDLLVAAFDNYYYELVEALSEDPKIHPAVKYSYMYKVYANSPRNKEDIRLFKALFKGSKIRPNRIICEVAVGVTDPELIAMVLNHPKISPDNLECMLDSSLPRLDTFKPHIHLFRDSVLTHPKIRPLLISKLRNSGQLDEYQLRAVVSYLKKWY